MDKKAEIREKALRDLRGAGVLMAGGHFDFGNGYHGTAYVNPHALLRQPSMIWRLAQDLLDLLPDALIQEIEVVAGPPTGGALFAHTLAGLLDSRRSLGHEPCSFAPFSEDASGLSLREFYRRELKGRRVLIADDVRNTGGTFVRCVELVREAGGIPVATVEICDRMESVVDTGIPNVALASIHVAENHPAAECPLCKAGTPFTRF